MCRPTLAATARPARRRGRARKRGARNPSEVDLPSRARAGRHAGDLGEGRFSSSCVLPTVVTTMNCRRTVREDLAMKVVVLASALMVARCAYASATNKPAVPEADAPRSTVKPRRLEDAVFELVNRHRREHRLTALVPDARIARQARAHSVAMAAGKTPLGHSGFDGRAAALHELMAFRGIAENVAFNQGHRDPAAEAVRGWLGSRTSPEHRRTLRADRHRGRDEREGRDLLHADIRRP